MRRLLDIIERASTTVHSGVNMLRRYYNVTAGELAAKLA